MVTFVTHPQKKKKKIRNDDLINVKKENYLNNEKLKRENEYLLK